MIVYDKAIDYDSACKILSTCFSLWSIRYVHFIHVLYVTCQLCDAFGP
jgi:hypothetical protein